MLLIPTKNKMNIEKIKLFTKKRWRLIVLVVGFLLWLWRLFHFSQSSVPLWYDPGLYVKTFHDFGKLLWSFDFSLLSDWNSHELLLGSIVAFFGKLWLDFDIVVTWWIWFLSIVPGFLFFFLLKKENKLLGALAAFLYWASITQYEVFYWNYMKQIFAVSLLLFMMIFYQKKKWIGVGILYGILAIAHRHTALFGWLLIFITLIIDSIREKKIAWKWLLALIIGWASSLVVYIPLWDKLIVSGVPELTGTVGGEWFSGDFMSRLTYLKYASVSIFFAFVWLYFWFKKKLKSLYFVWLFLATTWVVFGMFNFNRTLVFLDLFVIIFSALWIFGLAFPSAKLNEMKWKICHKCKTNNTNLCSIWKWFMIIILLALWVFYVWYINNHREPLISETEYEWIHNLSKSTETNAIVMTTHRNYTPRIMGYSQRDRISPGLSDINKRDFDARLEWWEWDGAVKCSMLKRDYTELNRPIYLRLGEIQFHENIENGLCFELFDHKANYRILKINL